MPKIQPLQLVAYALLCIGVVAAGASIALSQSSQASLPPAASDTATASTPSPSAEVHSPQKIAEYQVAADLPKYIAIPKISMATTRILPLGLTKNNQIATPNNINDAGWYSQSSKPGQPGAMFIYGHLSSWQANGAFYDLKKLRPGEVITITRGDDKTYSYQVVSSKIYPVESVDMGQVLAPIDASRPGLNLMTCAGHVIQGSSEFSERLVVFTSQIDP